MTEPYDDDDRALSPTWLYRYYDSAFDLIYVGITNQPSERNQTHATKRWHRKAVLMMLECFPLHHLAASAEDYAIELEQPRENLKARPPRPIGPMSAPWFFEESGNLLRGIGRSWVNPHDCVTKPIECPRGFMPPKDIAPRFKDKPMPSGKSPREIIETLKKMRAAG